MVQTSHSPLMLFYRCAWPPLLCRRQLKGHINSLREAHVALELYPMVAPGEAFEVQPFWRPVSSFWGAPGCAVRFGGSPGCAVRPTKLLRCSPSGAR